MREVHALDGSHVARIAAVAAVTLGSVLAFAGTSAAQDKTISTRGTEDVQINSKLSADLRFSPGRTVLESGDQLTLSALWSSAQFLLDPDAMRNNTLESLNKPKGALPHLADRKAMA